MWWIVLLIIVFSVPEETLEYMLGCILGGGYGLIVIGLIIAVFYGIFKYASDIAEEIKNHFK